MAFAIGSPPASQQRSRAPTPADELLRMRLQAVEAVEFRGTACWARSRRRVVVLARRRPA